MIKQKSTSETTSAKVADGDPIHKKVYQRPELRSFGSVHFLTRAGASSMNGDTGALMMPSDRTIKENIVQIGRHPLGIGLYLFDYGQRYREQYGHGRQFGVMADEVEAAMPAAVSVGPRGHKQVDYALLGITRPAR